MVPPAFVDFFMAMAQGGATLLGLIFVAVSIRHSGGEEVTETPEEATLADASLIAMTDGFVVSAFALVPNLNVADVALPMSGVALFWAMNVAVRLGWSWLKAPSAETWIHRIRAIVPTLAALVLAGVQVWVGVVLLERPADADAARGLAIVVVGYYGLALIRSWMLVGGTRHGLRAALRVVRAHPPARR